MQLDLLKRVILDEQQLATPDLTLRDLRLTFAPGMALSIVGARRCGKTYRTLQHVQELTGAGTPRENICRVLFNDHRLANVAARELDCIDTAYYTLYAEKRRREEVLFVFDEIHRIEGWEDYILYLLNEPTHKVLMTGSTSKLLSGRIASALRGKNFPHPLWPFSFAEFVRHCGYAADTVSTDGQLQLRNCFSRFLQQGGFPGLLAVPATDHRRLLQTYWDTMVLRDVIEAHSEANINIRAFNALAHALIARVACPMSMNRIAANIAEQGIHVGANSLYAYLDYMREAFMLETVAFFSNSEKIRNRNYRKVYCVDWGLAEAVAPGAGIDLTRRFENLLYVELRRRGCEVSYYRTRSGYEVDFVVASRAASTDSGPTLIQAAWSLASPEVREREVRALVDSAGLLRATDAVIVTDDEEEVIRARGLDIHVVPAWKWLLRTPQLPPNQPMSP